MARHFVEPGSSSCPQGCLGWGGFAQAASCLGGLRQWANCLFLIRSGAHTHNGADEDGWIQQNCRDGRSVGIVQHTCRVHRGGCRTAPRASSTVILSAREQLQMYLHMHRGTLAGPEEPGAHKNKRPHVLRRLHVVAEATVGKTRSTCICTDRERRLVQGQAARPPATPTTTSPSVGVLGARGRKRQRLGSRQLHGPLLRRQARRRALAGWCWACTECRVRRHTAQSSVCLVVAPTRRRQWVAGQTAQDPGVQLARQERARATDDARGASGEELVGSRRAARTSRRVKGGGSPDRRLDGVLIGADGSAA